jgi:hypothetical protein
MNNIYNIPELNESSGSDLEEDLHRRSLIVNEEEMES